MNPFTDPGRWAPTSGRCRLCEGVIWTRFPTRQWRPGDEAFLHLHMCASCDLPHFVVAA